MKAFLYAFFVTSAKFAVRDIEEEPMLELYIL